MQGIVSLAEMEGSQKQWRGRGALDYLEDCKTLFMEIQSRVATVSFQTIRDPIEIMDRNGDRNNEKHFKKEKYFPLLYPTASCIFQGPGSSSDTLNNFWKFNCPVHNSLKQIMTVESLTKVHSLLRKACVYHIPHVQFNAEGPWGLWLNA